MMGNSALYKYFTVFLLVLVIIVNGPSLIGFLRGFPLEIEDKAIPLGSFFKGVPFFENEQYINGGVFETIWTASERFLAGENVYDLKHIGAGPFVYPPLLILIGLLFLPIGWIKGYYLWTLFNIFFLIFTGITINKVFNHTSKQKVMGWILLLFSYPVMVQIAWGHYILLTMFFISLLMRGLHSSKNMLLFFGSGSLAAVSFITPFLSTTLLIVNKWRTICLSFILTGLTYSVLLLNHASTVGLFQLMTSGNPLAVDNPQGVNILNLFEYVNSSIGITIASVGILSYLWLWTGQRKTKNGWKKIFFGGIATLLLLDPWLSDHHIPLSLFVLIPLVIHNKYMGSVIYVLTNFRLTFITFTLMGFPMISWLRFIGVALLWYVTVAKEIKKHRDSSRSDNVIPPEQYQKSVKI